jgi:CubicO group peptidase (beta-lactamase class C family)
MDTKHLDALLEHFIEIGPPGCALLVSRGGDTVYESYLGLADAEKAVPVREDTLFRMYSNTKLITVTAAMILLERGLYLLDDPVSDYLPCFADTMYYKRGGNNIAKAVPAANPVTIRHLLSMTSGLTYAGNNSPTQQAIRDAIGPLYPSKDMTLQEFAKAIAKVPLAFEPGTRFNYGYSHDVMGAVIEVVSGKTLGAFMRDEIFGPLGMDDTWFTLPPGAEGRLAALYKRVDGQLKPSIAWDPQVKPGYKFESGGAGIVSTVRDMEKLSRALCMGGAPLLSRRTVDLLRRNQLTTKSLANSFRGMFDTGWGFLRGYGYGLGVKVMLDLAEAGSNGTMDEFGWAGAAGTWTLIDPSCGVSAFYAHQLRPGNMEGYCHPRLRNAIYAAL